MPKGRKDAQSNLRNNGLFNDLWWVGIEDITDTIKEYLLNPSSFLKEEQEDLLNSFEEWKKLGQYAFWWGDNFYMGKDGDVESS